MEMPLAFGSRRIRTGRLFDLFSPFLISTAASFPDAGLWCSCGRATPFLLC